MESYRQAKHMGLRVTVTRVAVRSAFQLMALQLRKVPVAGSVP